MKKILVLLSLFFLAGCTKEEIDLEPNLVNLNDNVIMNRQVNDLYITNTSLIYDNGITTLNINVENKGMYFSHNIKMIFKMQNGTLLGTMYGNLTIDQNEKKTFTFSSDIDLTKAYSLEYIVE